MESTSTILLALGSILLLGLVTSAIGRRTFLPRVTLLLLFGAVVGSDALNLIPEEVAARFELVANVALLMVGFLLGEKLSLKAMRQFGGPVLWISVSAATLTTAIVCAGLIWVGVAVNVAIVLGCIASATAPAAVLDVVMESGSRGRFKDLLLAIVAIDDAWALVLFGLGVAVATSLDGAGFQANVVLLEVVRDIGGGLAVGVLLGLPAAYLTGRLRPGQPILSEALGLVLLCGGIALWLEVSFLIAAMTMGAMIANLAKHHEYPFHEIENIEWPFMVVFFVLAGATLEMDALRQVGVAGAAYIICRALGKFIGARIGGELARVDRDTKNWMGPALLPQAGVAIGMALVAASHFPEHRQTLLSIVIGSTVFFEIVGPVFTRMAIRRCDRT